MSPAPHPPLARPGRVYLFVYPLQAACCGPPAQKVGGDYLRGFLHLCPPLGLRPNAGRVADHSHIGCLAQSLDRGAWRGMVASCVVHIRDQIAWVHTPAGCALSVSIGLSLNPCASVCPAVSWG